jgi:hypothetical protein
VVVGSTSPTQDLTLRNDGGADLTGITIGALNAPFSWKTSCKATLAAGATCTITVTYKPTAVTSSSASLTITASAAVNGAPVAITGSGANVLRTFSVAPTTLDFGNWAAAKSNVTSTAQTVTVTNTGNVPLAGGSFTFGGGMPQPFSRAAALSGGPGTCAATLAVGASCTYNVVFAPATTGNFSKTLAVTYTGATGTGTPVTLKGTGVSARATLSITPNPLTITLATGNPFGTGTVMLKNTAALGGSQVAVTAVAAAGGHLFDYLIALDLSSGADTCTGVALAPGASCTMLVDFLNVLAPLGVNRAGTISFTDTGASSPQTGTITGFASP